MQLVFDKTKITNFKDVVLFDVETEKGFCENFDDHRNKIINRIESLINQAIQDEDDVKLLVKTYLEMDVWGSPYTIANTIAESQQMSAALTPLKERYNVDGKSVSLMRVSKEVSAENKFSAEEQKENEQVYDEMTLIQYLETLQNKFLENC